MAAIWNKYRVKIDEGFLILKIKETEISETVSRQFLNCLNIQKIVQVLYKSFSDEFLIIV